MIILIISILLVLILAALFFVNFKQKVLAMAIVVIALIVCNYINELSVENQASHSIKKIVDAGKEHKARNVLQVFEFAE